MRIRCEELSKQFGGQPVLERTGLDVTFEHTLALIGPSGGGKSTLLRILAGLEYPDAGVVEIDGQRMVFEEKWLQEYRRGIGIVFQSFNLFPHLTALQNVLLPLEKVHRFADARDRAERALERFKLSAHAHKKPAELSGGQRQRVAIARALAIEPKFLLMDEPTSALDPEMTAEVLDSIAALRDAGQPLVLITHEMGFARETADVVAFLAERKILECTPAAEFFAQPRTEDAARFLSRILKY